MGKKKDVAPSIMIKVSKKMQKFLKKSKFSAFLALDELIDIAEDVDKKFARVLKDLHDEDYVARGLDEDCELLGLTFYGWIAGYPKEKFWKREEERGPR